MNNIIKNLGIKGKALIFIAAIILIFSFMFLISINASKNNITSLEYTEQASTIIKNLYEIDNYINQYKITSDANIIKKIDNTFTGLKIEANYLLKKMPDNKNKELLRIVKDKINLTEQKYEIFLVKFEEKKKYDAKKIVLDNQKIKLEKKYKEVYQQSFQLQQERIKIENEKNLAEKKYKSIKSQFDGLSNFIIDKLDNVIIKDIQQREMKSLYSGIEVTEEEKNLKSIAYGIIGQYTFLLKDVERYLDNKISKEQLDEKIRTLKEHIDQLDLYYISTNNGDELAGKVFNSISSKLNEQIELIEKLKDSKVKYETNHKEYTQNIKKYEESSELSLQSLENYNKNKLEYEKNLESYEKNQEEYEKILSELRDIVNEIIRISGEFYKNIKENTIKSKSSSDFSVFFLFSFITIICSIGFFVFKNYIANQETVNRRRLTSILNNMNDSLITIDKHCMIESCNYTTKKVLGYSEEELKSKPLCTIFETKCDNPSFMNNDCQLGKTIKNKKDIIIHKKDGESFYADIGLNSVKFDDKELFVLTIHDITHYKEIEKMKNEFVSTVSHELRTPLTVIKGAIEIMLSNAIGALPDTMLDMAGMIRDNSISLNLLINDILDIEKIASGKMEFDFKPIELMPLVENTIKNAAEYAKNYDVEIKLTDSVPSVMVYVDNNRIAQVITNLLSNASKFSHKGGIVEVSVSSLNNDFIRLEVKDFGQGISEDFQKKIFQRFVQEDSSNSRKKGGTGLGLAICKTIMDHMDGEIGFESQAGKGTTFYIDIPVYKADKQAVGT